METSLERAKPTDPLIGQLISERYRVEKRIGKGGMGTVYLAEHVLLRRKVALKVLSERAFASDELVARFHREAVAAASLGDEHIVAVLDMGQLDDGSYFVVLEYLDGTELGHAVEQYGALDVERAVRIVIQLCDALTAVHAGGIVHRDLKPENLFLVERNGAPDFVKVLDFGVCKVLEPHGEGERLTRSSETLGTPMYMAPEQIESSASVDARADVYAAAAILYYALAGQPPFHASTLPRLLFRICSEPPPLIRAQRPELPPALEAVIERAMHKSPDERYQSAAELRAALEPFVPRETAPARSSIVRAISGVSHAASTLTFTVPQRRGRTLVWLSAIALAVLLAIWLGRGEEQAQRAHEDALRATRDENAAAPVAGPTIDLSLGADTRSEPQPTASAPKGAAREVVRGRIKDTPPQPHAQPQPQALPQPEARSAPAQAPATDETKPAEPSKYRISQRELKDVFP